MRIAAARFIPAGAGNTPHPPRHRPAASVHPRRRGEHARPKSQNVCTGGSSPQARGTLAPNDVDALERRFIPAGAGNTRIAATYRENLSVHPRRRGEHSTAAPCIRPADGSSPQARGTQGARLDYDWQQRFIPAGAGNTRYPKDAPDTQPVHPRRRGEHDLCEHDTLPYGGSSPQARGTRESCGLPLLSWRFIPAGAGNTFPVRIYSGLFSVHPRRRGEH